MSLMKIYTYPDDILRKKCLSVDNISSDEIGLIEDMIETMFANKGVGLAASQVGVLKRIIIASPSASRDNLYVFINPVIVKGEGKVAGEEGCLSLPGTDGEVERYKYIYVKSLNSEGKEVEFEAKDFFARIIQHEIDHLNGILFIDHLGFTARQRAINILTGKKV